MTAPSVTALHPADSQQVFRAVLEALARPGTVTALPAGPLGWLPPALVPVFALADLSTGVCVLEDCGHRWADAITTATSAPIWHADMARLVAAVRSITVEEIRGFSRGSAWAPEDGAMVALAVRGVQGGPRRWRLSGPGVGGHGFTTLAPRGLPDGFVEARADAVAAYPAGIDVLLISHDGRVVGLPRTTVITEED